jgi:hypothetical protein
MARQHGHGPKRGQCDACPAIKGLAIVALAGRKLALCVECRAALRRIEKQRADELAKEATAAGITTAEEAGDLEAPTEDRQAAEA